MEPTWSSEDGNVQLYLGDCLEIMLGLADGSVDTVVTDPPYATKYNYLWAPLAEQSARLLKDGGNFISLCGHYQVPFVTSEIGKHLRFWWLLAMVNKSYGARLPGKWVAVRWKPAVWYVKGHRNGRECPLDCVDVTSTGKQAWNKNDHKWAQPVNWFTHYIERLTQPGDIILDPFMGSGTTGVSCVQTGRKFIGIEIDPDYFEIAKRRIIEQLEHNSIFDLN